MCILIDRLMWRNCAAICSIDGKVCDGEFLPLQMQSAIIDLNLIFTEWRMLKWGCMSNSFSAVGKLVSCEGLATISVNLFWNNQITARISDTDIPINQFALPRADSLKVIINFLCCASFAYWFDELYSD